MSWSYNRLQTHDYHWINIISRNYTIIIIKYEYLKPYNCVRIICIDFEYLMYNNEQKILKKQLHKNL